MTGSTCTRRFLLLSAAAPLALSGIVGTRPARAEDTIKIGLTTALTGPFNEFGEGMHRGVILAIEKRNRAGGVLGKQVELGEALDDQLVVGYWLRRKRAGTFVAGCCCRASLAGSVAYALSGAARPHCDCLPRHDPQSIAPARTSGLLPCLSCL